MSDRGFLAVSYGAAPYRTIVKIKGIDFHQYASFKKSCGYTYKYIVAIKSPFYLKYHMQGSDQDQ
jgi:hypothetical protein